MNDVINDIIDDNNFYQKNEKNSTKKVNFKKSNENILTRH